jgi:uncharacterized protein (TIGR02646 family)
MRQIIKLPLTQAVQDYLDNRIREGGKYPPRKNRKDSIKEKLLESQKYLCCYCECEIDENNVHIEHFFEQSDYGILHDEHSLNYPTNMIASCEGGTKTSVSTGQERRERKENTSCGHKKGETYHSLTAVDYDLLLNPHDNIEHLFSYLEGDISESKTCTEIEKIKVLYTIRRLALDAPKLNRRRKTALEVLQEEIFEIDDKEDIISLITEYLDDTSERLKPYFSTIKENFSYLLTA